MLRYIKIKGKRLLNNKIISLSERLLGYKAIKRRKTCRNTLKIKSTVTPTGEPLKEWYEGGYSRYLNK